MAIGIIMSALSSDSLFTLLSIVPMFLFVRFMFELWIVLFSINDKMKTSKRKEIKRQIKLKYF